MSNKQFFVTATDTDAGKTYVSRLLTLAFCEQKKSVAVFKPVSAGCELIDNNLVNEDAALLQAAANCDQKLSEINPIAFQEPIAPHIAAQKQNTRINIADIRQSYQKVIDNNADITLTEGAGGWRLPLGEGAFLSEFVQQENLDVILVVNMKLGCLNHALLTYQAIIADGLHCPAWVANCQQPMDYLNENLNELKTLLPVPCLGILTFEANIAKSVQQLDLSLLL